MKYWLELHVEVTPVNPYADILIARLSEIGFDFFTETESGLIAYANKDNVNKDEVNKILQEIEADVKFELKVTEDQNWNKVWEESFSPIDISGKCRIKAPFHSSLPNVINIDIEPKMSFGTGHHATTYMMVEILFEYSGDIVNKNILDMGCGTGVLAIIADKLGAAQTVAIDIEDWAYQNTIENIEINNCKNIKAILGNRENIPKKKYDFILANINKNILKSDIPFYADVMKENSVIALSGFFKTDCEEINAIAQQNKLKLLSTKSNGDWAAMVFENLI